ncbi:helix-hairpin-helix domain-containing protein [Rathayibacter sp. VKM Ac-2835]|uniref:ComEA family DNA-binding protein n=1 Tax=Rathayibacter sp. VKM Ac-2835 TaxID=2739043 RepID=UPI0015644A42|nr:ComEA family DNA-binding protein [Rathayibacter sp. VKM Ac-2835]NRG39672.1 helix-hairpin-helix domain-containing protein [Rathayibacter sp. VKM Ac-2835]
MQQTSQADDPAGLLRRPRRARSRWRIGVGAAMVLVIAAAVVAVLLAGTRASGRTEVLAPAGGAGAAAGPSGAPASAGATGSPAPSSSPGEVLFVHVAGAVAAPGLYLLDPGARVADALAAAGGFTEAAERAAVNLARRLVDGEQILVPERGVAALPGGTGPAAAAGTTGGIVSLSTATAAQLEELPEIGPATAAKIVAYREEHGPFTSVDQLLEVPGVGEKTLEAFREQVAP